MSANPVTVKMHTEIAEYGLEKLSAVGMRSSNKAQNRSKNKRVAQMNTGRDFMGRDHENFNNMGKWTEFCETTTIGNCWERATMFAHYCSQHHQALETNIYRCNQVGWDHCWAVITEELLEEGKQYLKLSALGDNAVIIDGWAKDWWLPNIGTFKTMQLGCWRLGTPFAGWVRGNIRRKKAFEVQTDISQLTGSPFYDHPITW